MYETAVQRLKGVCLVTPRVRLESSPALTNLVPLFLLLYTSMTTPMHHLLRVLHPSCWWHLSSSPIRGHPFMTSTRMGEGVRLRWTHVDGGRGSSAMWASTQKIKIRVHWRHTVFFLCKEVGVFFARILSLDRKKVETFLRYKLVI